ncbi:hypothetical protein SAMN02745671_01271 [Anaerovibrio lipolyticus DSM 3074]|uniref:Uncharacterized protein n=2 Tax=Anaerovibrio lipolyticus TaxID=82374 RepID=A0A0B2JWR2_9FIRM|nr:hypothetical protein [Anaerovibrio lipolyticus]KHM52069.1 hypothetical protein NZ47_07015 [Anaerovibrio lipolyticus]SHI65689.1 hypothetical protein SAMN02745671_01271 [Anaerovibrio lipolyticus DSM 3074]
MAENMTNLVLSKQATEIANKMKDTGKFPDALVAAKFGMAYAIKYYWDEIDSSEKLRELDGIYDAQGNHYNIGSVDPDKYISQIMEALYPDSDTPYKFARVLMCYGLNQLGDLLEDGKLFHINNYM